MCWARALPAFAVLWNKGNAETPGAAAPNLHAAVASAIREVVPSFHVAALPGHLQRPLDIDKRIGGCHAVGRCLGEGHHRQDSERLNDKPPSQETGSGAW